MKKIIYIVATLVMALPLWAQDPKPVVDTIVDIIRTKYFLPEEYHQECSNHLPYMWRKKDLRATDTYYDTVTSYRFVPHLPIPQPTKDTTVHDSIFAVDTIYTMNFTVNPTTLIERTIELRKGGKVEVRGRWYDKAGTYYDTIPSATTCDSILKITIVWAESFRQVESQSICGGNSITWRGQTLSQEGIYWDSLKTSAGYDSVFQFYLHVHYPFVHHQDTSISESDTSSFFWRGRHIAFSGDYHRTYLDKYGCDSTYYLHLTVAPSSQDTTITQYFCLNQGFIWRNTHYFEQKTFVDSLYNMGGGDSVVFHAFIPRDNDFHSDRVNHYEGEPIEWRGKTYVIDSIYQDTLVNQYGCDSILELRLVRKYDLDRNIVRCKGDTAMFHKEIIEQNCHRNDTLLSILGGDSIIHYHFSFASSFYSREFITICSNEYFEWTGHLDQEMLDLGLEVPIILHEEGIYRDRHRNAAGCDSIYEIEVKHSPAYIKDSIVLICRDSNLTNPVIWYDSKGKKYEFYPYQYLDTTIRDTMHHTLPREYHEAISSEMFVPVTGGCDSIFNFRFIITDRCSELDSIPMCTDEKGQNIPVIVDGHTYTEPGLYSNKMPSSMYQELLMKDSTHTFRIWLAPKDTSYDTVRWCESRLPVVYNNGQEFHKTSSDDYKVHFFNRYGCDSLVYLHIDIVPTVYSPVQVYDQFCPGDTIYVQTPTGKVFRQAGEFNDTVLYGAEHEWEGCDSIIRYRIEYKQAFFHSETHYLGVDSAYKWLKHFNDTILTKAGVYYDSCKNQFDCDSVYQLRLIYAQPFYSYETVHLCTNNLPYIWHTKSINKPGIYYDSLQTVYKLDSVYQLTVTIDSVYTDTIVKRFCEGDFFNLGGRRITTSGSYNDTLRTANTCDSIITYVVNFLSVSVMTPEIKHIAEGTSYFWHGKTRNQTGTYFDTIRSTTILDGKHACDSIIYTLQLYVDRPFYKEETLHVCSNQRPLFWHGKAYNTAGVHWDSCLSIYGIDSVYKMTLVVDSAYQITKTYHPCAGDQFIIAGQEIKQSGTYVEHLKTETCNCDSVIYHVVNFNSSTFIHRENLYCAKDSSIEWRGKTYNTSGDYADTIYTKADPLYICDSIIYQMHLTVVSPFLDKDSVTLCVSELPIDWRGQHITKAGIYTDNYKTARLQLDSIYWLKVDTLPTFFTSFNAQICRGNSYNFDGEVLTKPGTYVHYLKATSNGCDSIVRCILNYAPQYLNYEDTSYVHDSELENFYWHGKKITGEGYYFDTMYTTSFGCDSVIRLHVVKRESYFFSKTLSLCDCQLPYYWHDKTITQSGTYQTIYHTKLGMDSVYQIIVTVHPTDSTKMHTQLCKGQIYNFNGRPISQTGTYRDTMPNQYGCDSIIILYVTRAQAEETLINVSLCEGKSISIGGKSVSTAGNYYDTIPTHFGCDSILHYVVTTESFFLNETKTINQGQTYEWHKNGQPWILSLPGTYFDSCKTKVGQCDSVYRLELTVNQVEYIFPVDKVNICESELPYVWHNQSFYRDTVCQAKYKTKLGRDSIYSLDLKITRLRESQVNITKCDGETATIDGVVYTKSTSFTKTYKGSQGCDSLRIKYTLNFYPRYSSTQIINLTQGKCYRSGEGTPLDTTICTSGTYTRYFTTASGCDSTVTLIVTACPEVKDSTIHIDMCSGETYVLDGEKITTSTTRTRVVKTANGCDSIVTYIINFHTTIHNGQSAYLCQGSSYCWKGHFNDTILTKQGTYIDSTLLPSGCYNTSTLVLTYLQSSFRDTIISICKDKLPYERDGKFYYVDTVFYDTLPNNIYGCDSILRWHYQVNTHCSAYDIYQRCSNKTIYVEGLLINHAGTYSVNKYTKQGEDSVYRFIVNDVHPYEKFTTLAPTCDSLTYKGHTFMARGKGNETFQFDLEHRSIEDCDSIEHVTATIYSSSPKYVEYATIADYQYYRFEGHDYNVTGVYPVHLLNSHLCDSVRELNLTVLPTQRLDPVYYAFCEGDHTGLEIFGKMYFPTNDTLISDTTSIGGQPVIRTAVVNKHLPFIITKFDPQTDQMLCAANKMAFEVTYAINDHGAMPEYYDVDFMVGDLDIEPKHATYPVNGKTVLPIEMDGKGTSVNPGYYSYRIKFHSESCAMSDTSFTGTVLVRYPAEIMKANWGNVITLYEADYNEGHWVLQPPYSWRVWDKAGEDKTALVVPDNNTQPYIASNNLRDGDVVVATLYRKDYPTPIPSCPFVFTPNQSSTGTHPVLVYPTVTAKTSSIHIETEQQGEYQVYNATGHRFQRGALDQGDNLVRMPASDGCYLLKVTTADGSEILQRVIVH